jgi:hypothetical protein
VLRPLAFSLAATLVLFVACRRLYGDARRAALGVTAFNLLFFMYGYLVSHAGQRGRGQSTLRLIDADVPARWCVVVWLIAVVAAFIAAGRRRWAMRITVAPLNVMAVVMIATPMFGVASHAYVRSLPLQLTRDNARVLTTAIGSRPDIYYIVLDSYGRSDVLRDDVAYDNSRFVNGLRILGFNVCDCSQSNYPSTALSLASSLNMDYLPSLSPAFAPDRGNVIPLQQVITANAVRRSLASAGYHIVAFASGVPWSEWRDADVFLEPDAPDSFSEFEAVFMSTTALKVLDDLDVINLPGLIGDHYRQRTRLALGSFDALARTPGPKFVFMHVLAPHQPFVLNESGQPMDPRGFIVGEGYTPESYRRGYRVYADYVNAAILKGLSVLIERSPHPPIIVVQGDHAPRFEHPRRGNDILNAYFLPDQTNAVYRSISPVNTFRVILNAYFGPHYERLPDAAYRVVPGRTFAFERIRASCGDRR